MSFPHVTALVAGILLVLQMLLGLTVSAARGKANAWVGDAGQADLLRVGRRHANLAENAGIFVGGFLLLELSGQFPLALKILAAIFIAARLIHALGLSRRDTNNPLRLAGGVATYLDGIVLGGLLLLVAARRLA